MRFFRLSPKKCLDAIQQLSPLEYALYTYLSSLDPFGNGLEINLKEIATLIGRSYDATRKAINKIEDAGWLQGAIFRKSSRSRSGNKTGQAQKDNPQLERPETKTGYTEPVPDTQNRKTGPQEPVNQISEPVNRSVGTDLNSEVATKSEVSKPQNRRNKETKISQKKSSLETFLAGLNKETRERFKIFLDRKIKELPRQPALPQAWKERYYEQLWQEFEGKWGQQNNSNCPTNQTQSTQSEQISASCEPLAKTNGNSQPQPSNSPTPAPTEKENYAQFVARRAKELGISTEPESDRDSRQPISEDEKQRRHQDYLEKRRQASLQALATRSKKGDS